MNLRRQLLAHRPPRERVKTLALALGAAALLAISAGAGMAPPASAATIVTRHSITTTSSETGLTDDCRPGITGTIVGTDVFNYQTVETDQGFHFVGTDSGTGRIDWSDGTYTLIEFTDRISFNAVGDGTTVFTNAHEDSGDTYTADGVFLFRLTFHLVERFTVTDGDVTRIEFEMGHFHLFGDC
jgi:hypothetical protein